ADEFVGGGEGGVEGDGYVAGVGDEVDVGVGEFAADEASDFFDVLVWGIQFEVGWGEVCEGFAEVGGVRDSGDEGGRGLGERFAFGVEGGGVAEGDDFASGLDPCGNLVESFDGDAVGWGQDEDLVGAEADGVDGVGVDEVVVIACGEDGGDHRRGDEALHGSGDGDVAGGEAGPCVVGREQDGNLICRFTLSQQVADSANVAGDVGHDRMPWVVVVEGGGGVKRPAGFGDFVVWRRVRPAMAHDLVFAHEEVDVGFGLHVDRGGAEDGRVEPGEGLA